MCCDRQSWVVYEPGNLCAFQTITVLSMLHDARKELSGDHEMLSTSTHTVHCIVSTSLSFVCQSWTSQIHSASRGLLYFPCYNMSNYGRRVFSYAGQHAWNLLAENVRKSTSIAIFKRSLKTFLYEQIMHSAH